MCTVDELSNLRGQVQMKQSDLNKYQAENARLEADYDLAFSRVQQLERELVDVLHYQKKITEKTEVLESYTSGGQSRLGKISLVRSGQLEGQFLERMQSRLAERQKAQERAVDTIKNNLIEIKNKARFIEDEIDEARKSVMQLDALISTNQANIQAKKGEILQLEGNIRMIN